MNDLGCFISSSLNCLFSMLERSKSTWEQHEQSVCAAAIIVFSCFCFALAFKNKRWGKGRKRKVVPTYHRSLSMGSLHGGKVALQRILDFQHARVDELTVMKIETRFGELLDQNPPDIKELQSVAAKLEISGKEDKAIEMLNNAWKNASKEGKRHEAHELEMLLVEMLIYQVSLSQK